MKQLTPDLREALIADILYHNSALPTYVNSVRLWVEMLWKVGLLFSVDFQRVEKIFII